MAKFIPVDPDKWAEMVKAQAEVARLEHLVNYWKVEAETDNARWLRVLEENDRLKAEVTDLKSTADGFKAEVERLTKQVERLIVSLQKSHDEHGEALYKLKYKNERQTPRKKRNS